MPPDGAPGGPRCAILTHTHSTNTDNAAPVVTQIFKPEQPQNEPYTLDPPLHRADKLNN